MSIVNEIEFILNGGLGNQLFQVAGAIAICKQTSKRGVLIPVGYQEYGETKVEQSLQRRVEVDELVENFQFLRIEHGDQQKFRSRFIGSRVMSRMGLSGLSPCLIESGCRDGQWRSATRHTRLVRGFFRSAELVRETWDELKEPVLGQLNSVALSLPRQECIFHVRLGDYLTDAETNKVHGGIVSIGYLKKAALRTHSQESCLLISDSPIEAGSLLNAAGINHHVVDTFDASPWVTLKWLASADKLVGSNSTLSWWGAWIGGNLGQSTSVLPQDWYSSDYRGCPPHLDFEGLIRLEGH